MFSWHLALKELKRRVCKYTLLFVYFFQQTGEQPFNSKSIDDEPRYKTKNNQL